AGGGATRSHRTRLALGEQVHARGPRTLRAPHRPDPDHPARGHLPGAPGIHRLRHARDHRGIRGCRGSLDRIRRRGGPSEELIPHADVRRRHSVTAIDHRLEPGPRPRQRHSRCGCCGAYPDVRAAAAAMGRRTVAAYTPDEEAADRYDELYAEYLRLHDYFGRGGNDVMHRLKAIRREVSHRVMG